MVVESEQPADQRNKVKELVIALLLLSKVDSGEWLEALLLHKLVLVIKNLQHIEDSFHLNEAIGAGSADHLLFFFHLRDFEFIII